MFIAPYTSYPTADRFSTDFGYRDYLKAVASLRTRGSARPLSLYLHIPFCDGPCDKGAGKNRDKAAVYLSYLKREIEMQGRLFAGMTRVEQLHFGGATPSCLSGAQMADLVLHLRRSFQFAPDEAGEYAIEVDSRSATRERVLGLRREGFNRICLAMRDCDPQAQAAGATRAIIDSAREAGFRSVAIGLLWQDMERMAQTLATVVKAGPDRIAVYNCALLPDADARLAMLGPCIETLGAAGYVYIGMGDFARPGDDLAIAQVQGRLHCNCHGYSTHADMDLVACGVSAISAVAATYSQNVKTLEAYYDLIERNELPIERGIGLTMDDALRRTIIWMLMCQFELSIPSIEQAYPIAFADYFAPELEQLGELARDGLVTLEPEWLSVTARGRILIRSVCMVFDRYARTAWTV